MGLSDYSKPLSVVLPVWSVFTAWFDLISTPEWEIQNENIMPEIQVTRTAPCLCRSIAALRSSGWGSRRIWFLPELTAQLLHRLQGMG